MRFSRHAQGPCPLVWSEILGARAFRFSGYLLARSMETKGATELGQSAWDLRNPGWL